jgi:hypothetical protein
MAVPVSVTQGGKMNTKQIKIKRDTRQLINQAWIRNGDLTVTGEALILATLLHTTGAGRDSDDYKEVLRLMNDVNVEED